MRTSFAPALMASAAMVIVRMGRSPRRMTHQVTSATNASTTAATMPSVVISRMMASSARAVLSANTTARPSGRAMVSTRTWSAWPAKVGRVVGEVGMSSSGIDGMRSGSVVGACTVVSVSPSMTPTYMSATVLEAGTAPPNSTRWRAARGREAMSCN